jgi:phosphoglycerol transferase
MPENDGKAVARTLGAYGAAAALSVVAAVVLLELPRADLHVPFDYGGDALLYALITKSALDHGWFWTNPSLGAPGRLELHDFPASAHDTVHLLVIKAMSLFSGDWALLFNVYFLLGFPLIAIAAMAVFRHFRVATGPAIVGAVLYSFLPSRLVKGEGHIFMDVFFQVPLAVLVLLWVASDEPPLIRADEGPNENAGRRWHPFELSRARSRVAVAVCLLCASTCLYYAFFTAVLLVAGGAWAALQRRSSRHALAGVALAGVIVAGLAANGLPSVAYHARNGPNHQVADRKAWEAEAYGMKIAQLLLPVEGHRIAAFRDLKDRYAMSAPLNGESGATSLGVVGGAGFLALLGALVSRRAAQRGSRTLEESGPARSERADSNENDGPFTALAVFNLMAVLLGTIGGFGSLFAWLVSPQIRTYSRINVLIGFFAVFAVVLLVDRLTRARKALAACVLPTVLLVGLLDQASLVAARHYEASKRAYDSDARLVRRIEATVAPDAAILELPYQSFPEAPPFTGWAATTPFARTCTLTRSAGASRRCEAAPATV